MSALKACVGKTIWEIHGPEKGSELVEFAFSDGSELEMRHEGDCCETVEVYQVDGDTVDLVGTPLLLAEIVSSDDQASPSEHTESFTWTFVKFATVRGYVTVRWLGTSNGYYSETPSITLRGKS
jgi:hypothetical protein